MTVENDTTVKNLGKKRKAAKSSHLITCYFFLYYKTTEFVFLHAVLLWSFQSQHTVLFWCCTRVQSYSLLPHLATPFSSVLFISDPVQVDLTASHSSVLPAAICFRARNAAMSHVRRLFFSWSSFPAQRRCGAGTSILHPGQSRARHCPGSLECPSPGWDRQGHQCKHLETQWQMYSSNVWLLGVKQTSLQFFWFSSVLLCCEAPFRLEQYPSVELISASCTQSHIRLHIPWLQTRMLLTEPSFPTGWSISSENQENCLGTDMRTKGMASNLDIKKYANINCGRQVKFLRNNILTTTFQEHFSKINTFSNTFSHPSDSQVGSQKMWLALFHLPC